MDVVYTKQINNLTLGGQKQYPGDIAGEVPAQVISKYGEPPQSSRKKYPGIIYRICEPVQGLPSNISAGVQAELIRHLR